MEASNQNSSVNNLQLELKNNKNDIFKYLNNSNMTPKQSKCHVRRPQMKKFRKQAIV